MICWSPQYHYCVAKPLDSTTFVFLWKHNPRPTMKFTANFYYPADSNFGATVHCKYVGHKNYSCISSSVYHSSFTTHPKIYIVSYTAILSRWQPQLCFRCDFIREQIEASNVFAVNFLLKFMAIKWLNSAEITLGFGPKNYVFRCASRKENGLFELVFVKVQCNWLWQGTNWAKKTGRKVESTLKRRLLFCCRQQ